MERDSIRIMIVQETGPYDDLEACIDLAIGYIDQAAQNQVDLLIFGETWLTGYPAWLDHARDAGLWDHPGMKEVYAQTYRNALSLDSGAFRQLSEATRRAGIMVCIGANERVTSGPGNRSLYNAFFIFDQDGNLVHHHRKLMPTHTERLIHAQGDPRGLRTIRSDWGRIGGLICWEHWMPLSRQALHEAGETIHIALWPKVHEMLQLASRHYAFEGRCFVIAAGQVMHASQLPPQLTYDFDMQERFVLDGQSCIFGPDGSVLMPPQGPEIKFVIREIRDLSGAVREQMTLDVAGHYARPDIFAFRVKKEAGNK